MTLRKRFFTVFVVVFLVSFSALNFRFMWVSGKYYINKADFIRSEPSIRLFPIAEATKRQPLPNEATLIIDDISVTAPVIFGSPETEKVIYKNLEAGVVHYPGTPKPGNAGMSVILGHSSAYPWYRGDYGAVFALLNKLEVNDKVYIKYSDGRIFQFVVKRSFIFNPFGSGEELVGIDAEKSSIVLVSCWPVGTAFRRIAVQAELVI